MKRVWTATFTDKLALAALLLAILSIILSIWTAREQRRQWRATALARVEVVDVGFVHWRTLALDVVRSTKWGYNAVLATQMKERVVTGEYLLMNRVVARARSSGQLVTDLAGVTVPEVLAELEAHKIDPSTVELQQQFQIEFGSENIGQSLARAFQAEILGFVPDQQKWVSLGTSQPVDLGPGRRVQNLAYLHMALQTRLPDRLRVRIRLAWSTEDGDRMQTDQPLYYQTESAAWKFGE